MTVSLPTRKGQHNVENSVLCSCEHHACSPLLQRILHEEEQCKVWHVTSLFGCDLHPSGLNAGLNVESSVLLPIVAAFCPFFFSTDGLQQYGECCDGRLGTGITQLMPACWNVVHMFFQCIFLWREKNVFS